MYSSVFKKYPMNPQTNPGTETATIIIWPDSNSKFESRIFKGMYCKSQIRGITVFDLKFLVYVAEWAFRRSS